MKNLVLIFLIGLFAFSCTSPPEKIVKTSQVKAEFVQVADFQVQAPVMNAVDELALPSPDTPAPKNWLDDNLLLAASGVLGIAYEFLVRKIPTSRTLSILGIAYKILNFFIPDKSKNGGNLQIRDRL